MELLEDEGQLRHLAEVDESVLERGGQRRVDRHKVLQHHATEKSNESVSSIN